MDRSKAKIDVVVKSFVRRIKREFKTFKIILFGSRAEGTAWKYSDYDFIIVSDVFENVHWLDRISRVLKHWTSDRDVDVLPYSLKEFEYKKLHSGVVREAVENGIEV